uniref:Uncharacterized protein n=1 Tax=Ditylenchus dipsaci TaxID=166011 RepID=A0A915CYM8_9BILA
MSNCRFVLKIFAMPSKSPRGDSKSQLKTNENIADSVQATIKIKSTDDQFKDEMQQFSQQKKAAIEINPEHGVASGDPEGAKIGVFQVIE